MKRKPIRKNSWLTVLLVVAAVAIWVMDARRERMPPALPKGTAQSGKPGKKVAPAAKPGPSAVSESTGKYEVYRNCQLVQARNNDGDSFMVRLPGGKQAEFRLYFVDTPESAFKRYSGGDTNHARIRDQAAQMGGITPEQAVEIGKKGKSFTLGLLAARPFTLFTEWDSPFHDDRYHAFIEVNDGGETRWLHELLIERGLARLKTKPADLPDGTSSARQREHLRDLERAARRDEVGAWGL